MTVQPQPERPLAQRLFWFVALWFLGVASVATVAWLLRWWIAPHH